MTKRSRLATQLESIRDSRVLCVGDAMLDRYVYGGVERISPEAPIPVLHVGRETVMLGGAGNVARNIVGLGAKVDFVTVVGEDVAGRRIAKLLSAESHISGRVISDAKRQTPVKTRFIAGGQQLLRADEESVTPLRNEVAEQLCARAERLLSKSGALVLSDYAKGVLRPAVVARLIATANKAGRPVVIDPKGIDYGRYTRADVVTPNRRELGLATNMDVSGDAAIEAAARELMKKSAVGAVLVTRGVEGMSLIDQGGPHHFPAQAREVFDVSGAGDTVIAAIGAAMAAGIPLPDAARLANLAASIVVGKLGTAVSYADELRHVLQRQDLAATEAKIVAVDQAADQATAWREDGHRIGFTNGCFDLLHPGHIALLAQARGACDRLIVGLNTDASARRLKGAGRPIQGEMARGAVLASLANVDQVVLFEEDTPMALIEAIKPDILIKGADYTRDQVVGGDFVESYGGRVVLAKLVPGHSTTNTVAKLVS
ncbi:MAG: D-glycero-beta-D-manno-heptose-7-phosphate kinase [Alphaproteobacteria bacterium]|nr:D-glycero-beta-D-manno-heptose-7-phosphate kinase [Alphaproteobacteria bacterium]